MFGLVSVLYERMTNRLLITRTVKRCFSQRTTKPGDLFHIDGSLLSNGTIVVGQKSTLRHTFTQENVNTFATLCGDDNPLHVNPEVAKNSMFKGTIVHGIFVSSLFSSILGRSLPGAVYVSQSLQFKKPVLTGTPVTATIEVQEVSDKKKGILATMKTVVTLEDGSVAVDGEGKVLLLKKDLVGHH